MTRRPPPRARRRGALLLEIVLSGTLLLVTMFSVVQLLGWMASERRAAERRQWAVQAAANALEHLAALPVAQLTPERLAAQALDPESSRLLPGGHLSATLADPEPDDPAGLRRLSVAVTWRGVGGRAESPARLTAWVWSPAGEPTP